MSESSNGKSLWTAAGVCSGVVLTIVSGIGAAVERGYSRDRTEANERIQAIEAGNIDRAALLAALEERVEHVRALAHANRERVEAAFLELDTKLQRELNLADDTLRAELVNLDARLQSEIANNARRMDGLDGWAREAANTMWTRPDQDRFEAQAGLMLKGGQ